ncbi:MAG: flavin reductase family protein [Bacillota bacterium]|jgi:flavin reductase (DIM6/NTAB) family NADH-FMN oxidoreductase RutF
MEPKAKRSLSPSTALYPVPAVLVTCGDLSGEKNAITLAWVGTVSSDPPMIAIGVRPVRYSFGLIQRYGDFVVNLPRAEQADILRYCGTVSGRNEDKFAKVNLTAARGDYVRAPLVAEFPVNIECKVRNRLSLGSHDLFLGEVVSVHADPDVLTNGEVDAVKARPLAYFRGRYHYLGEVIPTGE